jgi:hypothetical protein
MITTTSTWPSVPPGETKYQNAAGGQHHGGDDRGEQAHTQRHHREHLTAHQGLAERERRVGRGLTLPDRPVDEQDPGRQHDERADRDHRGSGLVVHHRHRHQPGRVHHEHDHEDGHDDHLDDHHERDDDAEVAEPEQQHEPRNREERREQRERHLRHRVQPEHQVSEHQRGRGEHPEQDDPEHQAPPSTTSATASACAIVSGIRTTQANST